MTGWSLPASIRTAFAEVNRRYPTRSRASDGTIGDPRHAARKSDHNPDARGVVHAFDLTHDPDHGVDCGALAELLRVRTNAGAERRVAYLIFDRRIYSPAISREWRRYAGEDPHTNHLHVSIHATRAAEDDRSPWWPVVPERKGPPDVILCKPTDSGSVYLVFGRGDFVPVEDTTDRDRIVAAGVPFVELTPATFHAWTG